MSPQGELGQTAGTYKAVRDVANFTDGMARLAALFLDHPELKWLQATTDPSGHVDIIVNAGTGVLRDWVHALPSARRKQDIYSIHSGAAYEELLVEGFLTVHVRPTDPTQRRGGGSSEARMGLAYLSEGEQGLGTCSPTDPPCVYCGIVGGHNGNCPVVS